MTSDDEVRRFYDAVAIRYAELLPGPTVEQPLDLALLTSFLAETARTPGRVLVDGGCGTGRLTPVILDAGLHAIGVDPSDGMLAVARARFPDVRFETGDLASLPVGDAGADAVLAWYSIIHTPAAELAPIVKEFARVLRPGGLVLLGFQAGAGVRWIERGYGTDASTTAVLHDPVDVAARLREGGFVVDEVVRRGAVRERHDQGFVRAHLAGSLQARPPQAAAGRPGPALQA